MPRELCAVSKTGFALGSRRSFRNPLLRFVYCYVHRVNVMSIVAYDIHNLFRNRGKFLLPVNGRMKECYKGTKIFKLNDVYSCPWRLFAEFYSSKAGYIFSWLRNIYLYNTYITCWTRLKEGFGREI